MQKYMYYPLIANFENLIAVNKILKSNIIIYDKLYKAIYGFSQDNIDANVLKLYTPSSQLGFNMKYISTMQSDFPNFVAFSKDVSALYKIATIYSAKMGMDILDYKGTGNEYAYRFGVKAFRQTIIEEERICFDVLPFRQKMELIMSEMSLLQNTEVYTDILSIPEFNYALSQPAYKGIQIVRYNDNVYFIPPSFINNNKGDTVDLICKVNTSNNTKLMNFRINKSSGIIDVIYRQIIVPR